jgi:hypothetical protein
MAPSSSPGRLVLVPTRPQSPATAAPNATRLSQSPQHPAGIHSDLKSLEAAGAKKKKKGDRRGGKGAPDRMSTSGISIFPFAQHAYSFFLFSFIPFRACICNTHPAFVDIPKSKPRYITSNPTAAEARMTCRVVSWWAATAEFPHVQFLSIVSAGLSARAIKPRSRSRNVAVAIRRFERDG